jgi:hypothetical protein
VNQTFSACWNGTRREFRKIRSRRRDPAAKVTGQPSVTKIIPKLKWEKVAIPFSSQNDLWNVIVRAW